MIDRKLLKLPFRDPRGRIWIGGPKWKCPTCSNGVLRMQKDSFKVEETRSSKRDHNRSDWLPDSLQYVFSCLLECSADRCKEWVSCAGEGFGDFETDYDEFGDIHQSWETFFRPKYFFPHLRMFSYPSDTPADVANELEESFKLLFCSPSSASNHLRIAVENLLTALKVKRFKTSAGRRSYLSLHQRINLLPKKHEHLKELLFAIKWLGNAGSHKTHLIITKSWTKF